MFQTLVLSGGGATGFAQLGALHYLHEKRCLHRMETIVGTSIGSLIGLFIALKVAPKDMLPFFMNLKMEDVLKFTNIENFFEKFGADDGEYVMAYIADILLHRKIDPRFTFGDLLLRYKKRLVVTGSNVSKTKPVYFSAITHPKMRVLDAVRISIGIPFIFTHVKSNQDVYVDGGISDNYPLHWALDDFREHNPFDDPNIRVVGILLKSTADAQINSIFDFGRNLFVTIMNGNISASSCTIQIDLKDTSALDFEMPQYKRKELFKVGENKAAEYMIHHAKYMKRSLRRRRSI